MRLDIISTLAELKKDELRDQSAYRIKVGGQLSILSFISTPLIP